MAKGAARVRVRVSEDVRRQRRVQARRSHDQVAARCPAPARGSLTVRGLKAGRYSVQVRATDIAGNRSSLRKLTLNVR